MPTPDQLRSQLAEHGIRRGLRALADWRAKGLLPPLRRVGRGRAKGTQQIWDHDVLDQAIAAHYSLTKYVKADDALLCLWLSGYPIDARLAKLAWLKHLQRVRKFAERAALRSKDGYLGVGKALWRAFGKPEGMRDFVIGVVDSLFDDTKRDFEDYRATTAWLLNGAPDESRPTLTGDEAYRLVGTALFGDILPKRRHAKSSDGTSSAAVREAIDRCISLFRIAFNAIADDEAAPQDRTYEVVDSSWEKFGSATFLPNHETVRLVRSLTVRELNTTRESLAAIRSVVKRCVELTGGAVERAVSVRVQIEMLGSMGHYFAPQLIVLARRQQTWPMDQTILAIRDFVMHVQFTDIARKDNNNYEASPRVISEWTTAQQELSRLWAAVVANNKNESRRKILGRTGQPSGVTKQNQRVTADGGNAKRNRSH